MNHQITAIAPPTNPAEIDQISESVVDAVADASGKSPLDLQPLATVIDPDALESLVASLDSGHGDSIATVEFPYSGYTVTVGADGGVTVAE